MQNYVYDATFTGKKLIVGRTGCRKTYFTQKLAVNRFFGRLKMAEWVSYIDLSREREAEIESCFFCKAKFHYPKSFEQCDNSLETFNTCSKRQKEREIVILMTTKVIPPLPMIIKVLIVLEKKQPATSLLLWTTFRV